MAGILGLDPEMLMGMGAGVLSGSTLQEGLGKGMAALLPMMKERRQGQQIAQALGGPGWEGLSDPERQMLAANPQLAQHIMGARLGQRLDPMTQYELAQKKFQAEKMQPAQLQHLQGQNAVTGAQLQQLKMQTPEYRARVAAQYGMQPGSAVYNAFVISGQYSPDTAKFQVVPEGGVLVATDPRTGAYQEIARGNDKTKMPAGYRPTPDGNMEAVPGGPADIKMNEKRQQDFASATQVIQQLDELSRSVNRVSTAPGLDKNFGVQGYVPNVPGGKAADAAALLETLKTQGAFAALQEMRNASKTGGALGAVSDRENQMLQNAIAALQKAQSAKQVRDQLKVLNDHVETSKQRIRDAYNDHWNRGGEAAKRGMGGGPPTVRDDSDYNKLPSGARFLDPEGNERVKP